MHAPLWLLLPFLPLTFWPVTLPLLVVLIVLAVKSQGRRRRLATAGAAAIVVPPLFGFGVVMVLGAWGRVEQQAEYARTHSVLELETTLDGITFPAGTEIAWTDPSRTRWTGATSPRPIDLHGLPVRSITRSPQSSMPGSPDDWYLELAEPRRIGGWPCGIYSVLLTGEGNLLRCSLSEAMTWKEWTLPSGTSIRLSRTEGTVDVSVPTSAQAVAGQEIGLTLPSSMDLNDDGSPARAFFRRETPFLAAGVPLWGIVTWRYDPATRGQGRVRPALAVAGRTRASVPTGPEGSEEAPVVVHLPDGAVTPQAPGEG